MAINITRQMLCIVGASLSKLRKGVDRMQLRALDRMYSGCRSIVDERAVAGMGLQSTVD